MRILRLVVFGWGAALLSTGLLWTTAQAHDGAPHPPEALWQAWNWDPWILGGLALAVGLYARGVQRVWRKAGFGRGVSAWQAAAFVGGVLALFAALISPLDALSASLFSAHMVQHMLLLMAAAPLVVLGSPPALAAWALPQAWFVRIARPLRQNRWAYRLWQAFTLPVSVWLLFAGLVGAWHIPFLYQAAVRDDLVHFLEHASFLGVALLFWWTVAEFGKPGRLSLGAGVLFLFTAALQSGILGALMTFSATAWYPEYAASAAEWGLTPLEDQQLAGAIMWIPGGFVFLLAALTLMARWFQKAEAADLRRSERRAIR
jgi:putative membrane protein